MSNKRTFTNIVLNIHEKSFPSQKYTTLRTVNSAYSYGNNPERSMLTEDFTFVGQTDLVKQCNAIKDALIKSGKSGYGYIRFDKIECFVKNLGTSKPSNKNDDYQNNDNKKQDDKIENYIRVSYEVTFFEISKDQSYSGSTMENIVIPDNEIKNIAEQVASNSPSKSNSQTASGVGYEETGYNPNKKQETVSDDEEDSLLS